MRCGGRVVERDGQLAAVRSYAEQALVGDGCWCAAAVIAWERRLGVRSDAVPVLAPHAARVAGPPRRAAQGWDALGMPYHAALALGDSAEEADPRGAVSRLDALSPPAHA